MSKTRKTQIDKQKPNRVPMGRRQVLKVKGLEDEDSFHYHFFNDQDDRLYQAIEGGYEFVAKEGLEIGDQTVETARGTESVIKKGVGRGMVAYLMRIPKELYLQDQAEKQRYNDDLEAGIKNPKVDGSYGKIDIGVKDKA